MAFNPLVKAAAGSAITALRPSRAGAAVDRYNVIRNFFRHVASTPLQPNALPHWPRRLPQYTLHATPLVAFQRAGSSTSRPIGVYFYARHLHTTLLRRDSPTKPTSGEPPDKEPNTHSERYSKEELLGEDPDLAPPPPDKHHLENYSRFFQRLALSVPHAHRPTRDDLLNVATSFWQRLRIRFKWFTIKSFRKFNADDISAFVTWFLMSQTLWILVGTLVIIFVQCWYLFLTVLTRTTFFSVVFAILNSLRLQSEFLFYMLG
jgi:distribution and morphology protein 31